MFQRIEISGVHYEIDDRLRKYTNKKIGKLSAFLPRHARHSAHVMVKFIGSNAKDKKINTCEVILQVPQETLTVKESTTNMYASVDVVETKLRNQLRRYKERSTTDYRGVRKLLAKLRSHPA